MVAIMLSIDNNIRMKEVLQKELDFIPFVVIWLMN
jgi:hypothetical protein